MCVFRGDVFLGATLERFPFSVRAIRVNGGSEFKALFEEACRDKGIPLFELPPRSPTLNAQAERALRCHLEEFHDVYQLPWTVAAHRKPLRLREWKRPYNTIKAPPGARLPHATPVLLQRPRTSASKREELSPTP